jgi:hypothetical protein
MSWDKELEELAQRKALAAPLRTPGPPSFGYRP